MYHYNDPEVKNVLLSLIPGLKTQISLQSLHLMLQYPMTITEKEIFKLCQVMHRLNSLNDINFMFSKKKINRQSLHLLADCINGLGFLKNINWHEYPEGRPSLEIKRFTGSNIRIVLTGDKRPLAIAWSLQGTSQKKCFELKSVWDFTDKGFEELSQTLLEEAKSFQRLKLEINQCDRMSEEGFQRFNEDLKKLSCLIHLDLSVIFSP